MPAGAATSPPRQPAAVLEVVRRTAGSRLGLLFDTANSLVLGDDPLALLRQVSDRIRAGHVSNMRRSGAVA